MRVELEDELRQKQLAYGKLYIDENIQYDVALNPFIGPAMELMAILKRLYKLEMAYHNC